MLTIISSNFSERAGFVAMLHQCLVVRLLCLLSAITVSCTDPVYVQSRGNEVFSNDTTKYSSQRDVHNNRLHTARISPVPDSPLDVSAKDVWIESVLEKEMSIESGSDKEVSVESGSDKEVAVGVVDPGTAVQTGVCDRILLVSTLDGRLSAVDAVRGGLLWSVGITPGGMFESSLHGSSGVIPSLDGRLFRWSDGTLTQLPLSVQSLVGSSRQAVLGPWQRGPLLLSGSSSVTSVGVELYSGRLLYHCGADGCRTVGVAGVGEKVLILRQHRHKLSAADPLTGLQHWNISVAEHEVALTHGLTSADGTVNCGAQQQFGAAVADGRVWADREGMRWSHQFSAPLVHAWSVTSGVVQPLDLFGSEKGATNAAADLYFGVHQQQMYIQSLGQPSALDRATRTAVGTSFEVRALSQPDSNQLQHVHSENSLIPSLLENGGFLLHSIECENPYHAGSGEYRLGGEEHPGLVDSPHTAGGWTLHVLVLSVSVTVLINLFITRTIRLHYQRVAARAVWNFMRLLVKQVPVEAEAKAVIKQEVVNKPEVVPQVVSVARSRYLDEFEPISCLGSGGYGVVFEARNKLDDQRYAVKRTRLPAGIRQRRRVLREVACLAKLEHTNIVRYFNCWTERLSVDDVRLQDVAVPHRDCMSTGAIPASSQCFTSKPVSEQCSSSEPGVSAVFNDGVASQWKDCTLAGTRAPGSAALSSQLSSQSSRLDSDPVQFLASGDMDQHARWKSSSSGVFSRSGRDDSIVFEAGSGDVLLDMSVASTSSSHSPLFALQTHCIQDDAAEEEEDESSGSNDSVFLFIQVQLCRPETLRHWLQSTAETGTRCRANSLLIFLQILDGVEHLHQQQLMHRDLKPSNIFFAMDGVVKIGDFGLATQLGDCGVGGEGGQQGHTDHVGTRLYMSPEQAEPGDRLYDWRVDVYALGLLLLELLVPFSTSAERVQVLTAARDGWLPAQLSGPNSIGGLLVGAMVAHLPHQRPSISEIRRRCAQI